MYFVSDSNDSKNTAHGRTCLYIFVGSFVDVVGLAQQDQIIENANSVLNIILSG